MSNHLKREKSPYLLQHASNPVDWYPWCQEAFEKAKSENKPIFLSIGYATCHWCHVMEKESFNNPLVAKVLNEVFVNVKVDREELPVIDSLYMELAQALMAGHGGWPLNVVLTPELKPFFAATYLPPSSRQGVIGIKEFAEQIALLWHSEEKELLLEQADKLVELLDKVKFPASKAIPDKKFVKKKMEKLFEEFDPVYGGFKGKHKFPMAYLHPLLIAYSFFTKDSRALFLSQLTLEKMLIGGIYDPVGGGFSRYCIDEKWQVPHFEKMASDSALMALSLIEAYRYTQEGLYLEACCKTLDYLLKEMLSKEGGFCTAQDADSSGKEGYYYTWTYEELREILPTDVFSIFTSYYVISEEGNFEGRNILFADTTLDEFAEDLNLSKEKIKSLLAQGHQLLYEKRKERQAPFLDDKILTAVNGQIIEALALGSFYFNAPKYLEKAIQSAEFIHHNLYKKGTLYRRYREEEVRFLASLEDYVFLIRGLFALFEVSAEAKWLKWALDLTEDVEKSFKSEEGGYFLGSLEEEALLRRVDLIDSSEPSANSVHAENLLKAYQITGATTFLERAEEIIKSAMHILEKHPTGAANHLHVLQRYLDNKALAVVIALDDKESHRELICQGLKENYYPYRIVIWKKDQDKLLEELCPALKEKVALQGKTTLYLCSQEEGCLPPIVDPQEMQKRLQTL